MKINWLKIRNIRTVAISKYNSSSHYLYPLISNVHVKLIKYHNISTGEIITFKRGLP